ncbi:hypothetical protein RHMOL_Rhmol04G0313100 [Rhododendron molle]|uniref:Uncharacterized protein n=1 Tax=Rhododendron molle TaxID=49168 RepID=A0ACC0P626_RHOML|nr:hypothetical protein RHMOL_Rhmol04G0313100 [Rhododendron molle]
MDPDMYAAAMNGKVDDLDQYSADQFALQVTPNGNTLLHVAAEFHSSECVPAILSKCPSLLYRANTDGDTPIHVALARSSYGVVRSLIEFAKSEEGGSAAAVREMLRARNHDGDTPLHLAARYCNWAFFEKLFTEEDPGLDHGPNKAGETPLYLYAERGYGVKMLSYMLKTCTPLEYGGPGGKTALHAAVIRRKGLSESSGSAYLDKFLDKLIEWKKDLIKEPDAYGRTPLHYAADNGDVKAVQKLLDKDKSVAYVTANNDEGNTALHMATAKGHTEVMKELLSKCPDCWEMVNRKGRNILHISTDLERDEATKYISEQPWVEGLVDRKDHEGNTPMHVLAHKGKQNLVLLFRWEADMKALNNEGLTPDDILLPKIRRRNWLQRKRFLRALDEKDEGDKGKRGQKEQKRFPGELDEKDEGDNGKIAQKELPRKGKQNASEEQKGKMAGPSETVMIVAALLREKETQKAAEDTGKMADTHMIVATLISTISFAAGFTIPGGYHGDQDPNQGTAVLVREAAFKAFVISNTIAVICSTSSVFLYVSASLFNITGHEGERRAHRYGIAFGLIITAMLAMMLAFITGAYAVLARCLGLAIVTCVIASSPFIVYAFELKKHFAEEIAYVKDSLSSFWEEFTEPLIDFCDKCIRSVRKVERLIGRERRRGE